MAESSNTRRPGLLTLPAEVRNMIYQHLGSVLLHISPKEFRSGGSAGPVTIRCDPNAYSILHVCRQLRHETLQMRGVSTTICLAGSLQGSLPNLPTWLSGNIREIVGERLELLPTDLDVFSQLRTVRLRPMFSTCSPADWSLPLMPMDKMKSQDTLLKQVLEEIEKGQYDNCVNMSWESFVWGLKSPHVGRLLWFLEKDKQTGKPSLRDARYNVLLFGMVAWNSQSLPSVGMIFEYDAMKLQIVKRKVMSGADVTTCRDIICQWQTAIG